MDLSQWYWQWWYILGLMFLAVVTSAVVSIVLDKRRTKEFERLFGFVPKKKMKGTETWTTYQEHVESHFIVLEKDISEAEQAKRFIKEYHFSDIITAILLEAIDNRIISLHELKEYGRQAASWFDLSDNLQTKQPKTENSRPKSEPAQA